MPSIIGAPGCQADPTSSGWCMPLLSSRLEHREGFEWPKPAFASEEVLVPDPTSPPTPLAAWMMSGIGRTPPPPPVQSGGVETRALDTPSTMTSGTCPSLPQARLRSGRFGTRAVVPPATKAWHAVGQRVRLLPADLALLAATQVEAATGNMAFTTPLSEGACLQQRRVAERLRAVTRGRGLRGVRSGRPSAMPVKNVSEAVTAHRARFVVGTWMVLQPSRAEAVLGTGPAHARVCAVTDTSVTTQLAAAGSGQVTVTLDAMTAPSRLSCLGGGVRESAANEARRRRTI